MIIIMRAIYLIKKSVFKFNELKRINMSYQMDNSWMKFAEKNKKLKTFKIKTKYVDWVQSWHEQQTIKQLFTLPELELIIFEDVADENCLLVQNIYGASLEWKLLRIEKKDSKNYPIYCKLQFQRIQK